MPITNLQQTHWLRPQYQQMITPFVEGRFSHATAVSYLEGVGEKLILPLLAKRLLCEVPITEMPCQKCHSCQLFEANNHPDFKHITLQDGKNHILIEQIRALTQFVYEYSKLGGNKVIWIEDAHTLTESAANALLKMLEEPSDHTYFILTYKNSERIMPTIRSRCILYQLTPPRLEDGADWLRQNIQRTLNDNQLNSALLLSHLAPLSALELIESDLWELREEYHNQLHHHFSQSEFWELSELLIKHSSYTPLMIQWFISLLNDAIKAKQKTGAYIYNRDAVPLIRQIALLPIEKLFKLNDLWSQSYSHLTTVSGINQELVIYHLMSQSELMVLS